MNVFVKLIAISISMLFSTASIANAEKPEVEIASHKDVFIQRTQVNEIDGRWVVTGQIKLRWQYGSIPWPTSHIDYLVTDQDGANLAEGAVNYSKKLRHRQKLSFLPKFSITLPEGVDSSSKISIGFHEIKPVFDENPKVTHVENVLR